MEGGREEEERISGERDEKERETDECKVMEETYLTERWSPWLDLCKHT